MEDVLTSLLHSGDRTSREGYTVSEPRLAFDSLLNHNALFSISAHVKFRRVEDLFKDVTGFVQCVIPLVLLSRHVRCSCAQKQK